MFFSVDDICLAYSNLDQADLQRLPKTAFKILNIICQTIKHLINRPFFLLWCPTSIKFPSVDDLGKGM